MGNTGWFFLGFFLVVGVGGMVVVGVVVGVRFVGGGGRCDSVFIGESHGHQGR